MKKNLFSLLVFSGAAFLSAEAFARGRSSPLLQPLERNAPLSARPVQPSESDPSSPMMSSEDSFSSPPVRSFERNTSFSSYPAQAFEGAAPLHAAESLEEEPSFPGQDFASEDPDKAALKEAHDACPFPLKITFFPSAEGWEVDGRNGQGSSLPLTRPFGERRPGFWQVHCPWAMFNARPENPLIIQRDNEGLKDYVEQLNASRFGSQSF